MKSAPCSTATPSDVGDIESSPERRNEIIDAKDDDGGLAAEAGTGVVQPAQPDVPDGGFNAWLNNAGCFIAFQNSFGIVNAFGTFQSYYKTERLSQQNESVIALIGALQLFLLYGLSPLVGKIYDSRGVLATLPAGGLLIVLSLFLLSITQPQQLYQHFLTQSIMFGIGASLVFTSCLAHTAQHFKQKRALAIGIVAAGSSLGGVLYPILVSRLIPRIGFGWAVRVLAFISLACFIFSSAVCRMNLPLRETTRRDLLKCVDFGGFKDKRYCLAALSAFLCFYGIFIPFFYIRSYAEARGVPETISIYLLAMVNGMGVISRIIPAIFAPRMGILNLIILFTSLAAVSVLALWLPAENEATIIAFALIYGFMSGPYISLLPAYIGKITEQQKYGARLGTLYLVVAVACLAGTPTGGALVGSGTLLNYQHAIGFTAALLLAGTLVIVVIWVIDVRTLVAEHKRKHPDEKLRWTDFKV